MKCVVVIFTLYCMRRITYGQGIMEDRDTKPEPGSIVVLEDRSKEPGDDSIAETTFISRPLDFWKIPESPNPKPGHPLSAEMEIEDNGNVQSSLEANAEAGASESDGEIESSLRPENDEGNKKILEETMQRFASEMAAGDTADLIGQNEHVVQASEYTDLGRRFVPQYKYTGAFKAAAAEHDEDLKPEKAPPELVLVIAKESALLGPDKDADMGTEADRKKILRSGDYWDGIWKEEVVPKNILRTGTEKKVLGSIKAKVKPGSEFYKVVSRMKKISPRLLYIINKKQL